MSASVAKSIENQAGYIKNKGLDDQYYKTLIIEYLKQYSKANRKVFRRRSSLNTMIEGTTSTFYVL